MEIQIKPGDVDQLVREAIVKSMLGARFAEAVDKALAGLLDGWDSPVKRLVVEAAQEAIRARLAKPDCREKINAAVAGVVTSEAVAAIVESGLTKLQRELKDRG